MGHFMEGLQLAIEAFEGQANYRDSLAGETRA